MEGGSSIARSPTQFPRSQFLNPNLPPLQVCMYLSDDQTARINTALQVLGARGVTVMGSSGDGGSHFSFGPFQGSGDDAAIADALNEVSCKFQMPVFPTASPYVLSIGGEMWEVNSKHPVTWAGYGGGESNRRRRHNP